MHVFALAAVVMAFLIPAGTHSGSSPDAVARQRKLAEALLSAGMQDKPIQHPLEGVGNLAEAFVGALGMRRANRQEAEGRRSGNEALMAAFAPQSAAVPTNGASASLDPRAMEMARQLVTAGHSPEAASGIVGRSMVESNLDPAAVGDNGSAFGAFQYRGDRRTALENFARSQGKDVSDIGVQLAFLDQELKGPEALAGGQLSAARTPEDAATAMMHYERPQGYTQDNPAGGLGYDDTKKNAAMIYELLNGGGGTGAEMQTAQTGAPNTDMIRALLGNEWVDPAMKSLALERLLPAAPFSGTLSPGQHAFVKGRDVASIPPNDLTAANAGEFGVTPVWGTGPDGKPAILQLNKAGGAHLTELPPNFTLSAGVEKIDLGTAWGIIDKKTGQMVGTTPKDVAGEAAAKAIGEAQGTAAANIPKVLQQAEIALRQLQAIKTDPNRELGTGASAWTGVLPGSWGTRDFANRVNQLKGQAFLSAFESLKGGGQITNVEGEKATQAIARLDPYGSEEGFMQALSDLEEVLNSGIARARQRAGQAEITKTVMPSPETDLPAGVTEEDIQFTMQETGLSREEVLRRYREKQ